MNGNDILDALSGLDPKYIDEAAFELHAVPVLKSDNSRIIAFKKGLKVALPAVAAIFITVTVALPAIMRFSNSGSSSSAPASDSAMYDEAPSYDAREASPAYEAEGAYDYEPIMDSAAESAESNEPIASVENMAASESSDESEKSAEGFKLSKAEYDSRTLTVEISGTIPDDADSLYFKITSAGDTDSEIIFAEGVLSDVISTDSPLTLEISDLDLDTGTYTLTVGDEHIDFTIN